MRSLLFALCIFSLYSKQPQFSKNKTDKISISQSLSKQIVKQKSTLHKSRYKKIKILFFSDVKCRACQKMHETLSKFQEFLLLKNTYIELEYKPIITTENSVSAAFIAAEAINQGKINEFIKSAYPKDKSKFDDINPELIGAQIGITEIPRTDCNINFIKLNQNILKKFGGTAPLIIIKNYDDQNHDLNISGTIELEKLINIFKKLSSGKSIKLPKN